MKYTYLEKKWAFSSTIQGVQFFSLKVGTSQDFCHQDPDPFHDEQGVSRQMGTRWTGEAPYLMGHVAAGGNY